MLWNLWHWIISYSQQFLTHPAGPQQGHVLQVGVTGHFIYVLQPLLNNFFLDHLEWDNKASVYVYVWKNRAFGGERSLCFLRQDDFSLLKRPFYANGARESQVIWLLLKKGSCLSKVWESLP